MQQTESVHFGPNLLNWPCDSECLLLGQRIDIVVETPDVEGTERVIEVFTHSSRDSYYYRELLA